MLFRKITEDIQKWMDPTVQRQQFVSLDKVVFPQLDKNDLPAMTYDKELPLGGFFLYLDQDILICIQTMRNTLGCSRRIYSCGRIKALSWMETGRVS